MVCSCSVTRVHAPLRLAVVRFGSIDQALVRDLVGDYRAGLAQVRVSPASLAK